MTLSTNLNNNTLQKQYNTQIKNNNYNAASGTMTKQDYEQEKATQEALFKTMISQMMNGNGGSMMSEAMINSFTNKESSSLNSSLSTVTNFNSNMRGASQSLNKNYSQGIGNSINSLGLRASKYESNLDPGAISNDSGDYGGKSYGAWQFSSKTGSLDSFINSLKGKDNELYSKLSNAKAKDGNTFGKNFDAVWKDTTLNNKDKFLSLQQGYIKQNFYDKTAQELKSKLGFDISNRSNALKESLWSTAVQHGVGGAVDIFSKLNLNNSDSKIINDLYTERQNVNKYFRSSSDEVKQSVYNRFTTEKKDMLNMLNEKSV